MFLIALTIWVGLYASLFVSNTFIYQRQRYDVNTHKKVVKKRGPFDCEKYYVQFTKGISYIYDPPKKDTVILFSHGTGTNLTTRNYIRNFCNKFGFGLFLYDYYGYGCSDDVESYLMCEKYLQKSAEVAYKKLRRIAPNKKIVCMGESIGCCPTTWLASKYQVDKVVLCVPFDRISNIFRIGSCATEDLNNCKYCVKISAPTLVVAARYDELIGYKSTMRVYNSLRCDEKDIYFGDNGHNDYFSDECQEKIAEYISGN